MTQRDSDQCQQMAHEAAAAAARHDGISIEIRLLCRDGYHLWSWVGTLPRAMEELAVAEPQGGTH